MLVYSQRIMNKTILENVARDFSKFCDVDMNPKFELLSGSIDEMLIRLEEFQTMLSFVKQDRIDYNDILSSVPNYSIEFDEICKKIDVLETLMAHIEINLDHLEQEIEKAENMLKCSETTALKVSNIFTPLFKKPVEKKVYRFSDLFRSEDYFIEDPSIPNS